MKKAFPLLLLTLAAPLAIAHPNHDDLPPGMRNVPAPRTAAERPYGRAGNPAAVSRTISVDMSDAARCSPDTFNMKRGETVKILARNSGTKPQEFAIGTQAELKEHADMLKKFPTMQTSLPHRVNAKPGETAELVWRFTQAGEFGFSCAGAGLYAGNGLAKVVVAP